MWKINIIDNIFLDKGILHTYGREGIFTKVFLKQGNLEGKCAVYSLMMLLMLHGKLNRDDLLHRVSNNAPDYIKKLKKQFRYSNTRGYSFKDLRIKLLRAFNNKLPIDVFEIRNREEKNLRKLHQIIMEQLDRGYPVQIGLWDLQRKVGHSVVAIGYSQFDQTTIRLYCLDPSYYLPYASFWNNVIDLDAYYYYFVGEDHLDFSHMANGKVLVDSILLIDENLELPFEPEENDSILPF